MKGSFLNSCFFGEVVLKNKDTIHSSPSPSSFFSSLSAKSFMDEKVFVNRW